MIRLLVSFRRFSRQRLHQSLHPVYLSLFINYKLALKHIDVLRTNVLINVFLDIEKGDLIHIIDRIK